MIDFGKTADDYIKHRAGFPDSFFEKLSEFKIGIRNQILLDLGCGTGTLAKRFARANCIVTALDISEEMISKAIESDRLENLSIVYKVAKAESTRLDKESFDVITAGQCWHWFDSNEVMKEAFRLLKNKGRLVIAHFDWLPIKDNVPELTENLILKHNPNWQLGGGNGLYPQWAIDASNNGFHKIESFSYDLNVSYSHSDWRGRVRASAGISASLSENAVDIFDREHEIMLNEKFGAGLLSVPHRVFAVIAVKDNQSISIISSTALK